MQLGYHDLPNNLLATVVTSLKMTTQPTLRPEINNTEFQLTLLQSPDVDTYKNIFRRVGQEWLWRSRLALSDDALLKIIQDPYVEIRMLTSTNGIGLLELDFRKEHECELVFFGLSKELIGTGAGRWLMNRALEIAWSRPLKHLWVHTCTFDHPAALDFYQRSGFVPFERKIEVMEDPRLMGLVPSHVAPHIPILS